MQALSARLTMLSLCLFCRWRYLGQRLATRRRAVVTAVESVSAVADIALLSSPTARVVPVPYHVRSVALGVVKPGTHEWHVRSLRTTGGRSSADAMPRFPGGELPATPLDTECCVHISLFNRIHGGNFAVGNHNLYSTHTQTPAQLQLY